MKKGFTIWIPLIAFLAACQPIQASAANEPKLKSAFLSPIVSFSTAAQFSHDHVSKDFIHPSLPAISHLINFQCLTGEAQLLPGHIKEKPADCLYEKADLQRNYLLHLFPSHYFW